MDLGSAAPVRVEDRSHREARAELSLNDALEKQDESRCLSQRVAHSARVNVCALRRVFCVCVACQAINLKDEASVKCSAPYRAPELMEVPYPGVARFCVANLLRTLSK